MSSYYGLFMNMMRDRAERVDLVAVATTREALVNWMENQRADEEYTDDSTSAYGGKLRKTFKPGTPLEYYNPPPSVELGALGSFGEGIQPIPNRYEHVLRAGEEWDVHIGTKFIDGTAPV